MTAISRRVVLAGGLAASVAFAQHSAVAAPGDDAKQFVNDLAQHTIALMADHSLAEPQRAEQFRAIFTSAFDIPAIVEFVLGRYWRSAGPDRQKQFIQAYEALEVQTWARRFTDYHGETVQILSAQASTNDAWIVDTQIQRPNNRPIDLQWKIHKADGGQWRIIDMVVENVSMALTRRQEMNSILQGNAGNIDALIKTLADKAQQLQTAG